MPLPPELTEEIKKNIKASELKIKELKPEIERARLAGIDVSEEKKELVKLEKQTADLKLQYGK